MSQTTEAVTLTTAEAAALLGIDPRTLRKAAEAGRVPCLRFGRVLKFPVAGLQRLLLEGMAPVAPSPASTGTVRRAGAPVMGGDSPRVVLR